jgi:hypothetical protein
VRALAVLIALSSVASAHDAEYQPLAVSLDVDLSIANFNTDAVVVGQLTWAPGDTINRWDVVHPTLRRFVRHPNELWLRAGHDGSGIETWSGAYGGAQGFLANGHLYGLAEAGVQLNEVSYDNSEEPYWTVPVRAEVGFRPTDLLSIGVTGGFRPIVGNGSPNDGIVVPISRSGSDFDVGGTATIATADDRMLLTLHGGYRRARWSFIGLDPGDTDVDGMRAGFELAIQSTPQLSLILTGNLTREDWNDKRAGDEDPMVVGVPLDRIIYGANGTAGIIFWYRGEIGLRVVLGGGYLGKRPLVNQLPHGWGSFGFGIERRF